MPKTADDTEWLAARQALLDKEKAFQRARDELAQQRRELPWRRIHTNYEFATEDGPRSLAQLFGDASQLIVYHFMFHPDWDAGCKSCSFWADSYDGAVTHLKARDVALVAISRAPLDKLLDYRDRMGWSFPWVSSAESTFNFDFGVSFTPEQIESGDTSYNFRADAVTIEELPGISVFVRDGDKVFHTYSTYARGLDPYNSTYQLLDIAPYGRNEADLPDPQDWVRRHDEY